MPEHLRLHHADNLTSQQATALCSWISDTGQLGLISGEVGNNLSTAILGQWLQSATLRLVLQEGDQVVGLATLSLAELQGIPLGCIEVCHVITHPVHRRKYGASRMLIELQAYARDQSYERIIGRVVKGNMPGAALLESLRWKRTDGGNQDVWPMVDAVDWYMHRLTR